MIKFILITLVGSILNRWRGSGKDPKVFWLNYLIKSKTPKLIIMFLFYGSIVYLEFGLIKAILSALIFGCMFTIGWGYAFAMGRGRPLYKAHLSTDRLDKWYYKWWTYFFGVNDKNWTEEEKCFRDFIFMTMRGLLITCFIGLLLYNPIIAISGATMGIVYYSGWYIAEKIGYHDPICICEYLFGATLFSLLQVGLFFIDK